MKLPDDNTLETLLQGTIRQPSERFENAFSAIAEEENKRKFRQWITVLRPLAIAATLLIATALFFKLREQPVSPTSPGTVTQTLDQEWVELLSLADTLSGAESLADPEARLALEYYAFNE